MTNDFRLKWKTVWTKDRTNKEAGLLWLIWHRAVAVNHWRGRIDRGIDIRCPVCPRRSEESVLHRFWEYHSAQRAWQWAIHIMNALISGKDAQGPWQPLTWKQGIFSDSIPRKFNPIKRVWMELRTVVLRTLWIERNDKVFSDVSWPPEKLMQTVWGGIIDYGRVEWDKVTTNRKSQVVRVGLYARFIERRGRNEVFATFLYGRPLWQPSGPITGFVFEPP